MLEAFLRFERWATRAALAAAVVLLALAAALAFYQVITRFVFNDPSHWSEVGARMLVIWSVFLGAASAFRVHAMLRVEVLFVVVPPRYHRVFETAVVALILIFLAVLLWYGGQMAYRVRNQTLAGMDMSIAWGYAALPVGAAFGMLGAVGGYLERHVRRRESVAEPASEEEPA